jgi:hypothetical protein
VYTVDHPTLVEQHVLTPHLYADNTQIYGSYMRPSGVGEFISRLATCAADVVVWMQSNRLQLNVDETEYTTSTVTAPSDAVAICGHDVTRTTSARNLDVFFNADLGMRRLVDVLVSRCFAALRQLRAVRQYVTVPVVQSLGTPLVLTRMDYGNSIFFRFPAIQLRRLQSVQNSAARLIFNSSVYVNQHTSATH